MSEMIHPDEHDRRVAELLEANNRYLEEARAARRETAELRARVLMELGASIAFAASSMRTAEAARDEPRASELTLRLRTLLAFADAVRTDKWGDPECEACGAAIRPGDTYDYFDDETDGTFYFCAAHLYDRAQPLVMEGLDHAAAQIVAGRLALSQHLEPAAAGAATDTENA